MPQRADLATILETAAAVTMRHVTAHPTSSYNLPLHVWLAPTDHIAIVLNSYGCVALVYGNGDVAVADNAYLLTPHAPRPLPVPTEALVLKFQRVLEAILRGRHGRFIEQISN